MKNMEIMENDIRYQACAAQHFGLWWVEETWMLQAVDAFNAGCLEAVKAPKKPAGETLYINANGVAQIPLVGYMTKGANSFGGSSTVGTRRALRIAARDEAVEAILIYVDSPGGTVAGTADLADEIVAINRVKPVYAHIDDLGASAAYYAAAGARRITANANALVGSLGTILVLRDYSEAAERDGVKVHVIITGKHKGTGVTGAPIDDEQLAAYQENIDDLGQQFITHINITRDLSMVMGKDTADGRVFIAAKAKKRGLIDEVQSFDTTLREILGEIEQSKMAKQARGEKRILLHKPNMRNIG